MSKKIFHDTYPIEITGLNEKQIEIAIKEYLRDLEIKKKILSKYE